ncbi:TPA: hypothetical protein LSH76_000862 [Morganella morganii]|uniref:hypothetical protein n=1 Tax=Morganella TaxID=581 RepID=UPI00040804E5|nr:hypothetical protein [Morganella sp. HMSC11D09]EKL3978510.1 hypothetical protein [Morganella morganii]ETO44904.1 hypothetical protein X965_01915 [Morganella sp. EGD-HP17]HDU8695210.1 hypothetical protein [Morganella morganii subsp. morganii]EME4038907.1 hypothetical protein [Morganella morganii]MDU0992794.1 hypothetical protein [Morganella morganii]
MVTFTASRKAGFFLSGDPEKEAGKTGKKAAITKGGDGRGSMVEMDPVISS